MGSFHAYALLVVAAMVSGICGFPTNDEPTMDPYDQAMMSGRCPMVDCPGDYQRFMECTERGGVMAHAYFKIGNQACRGCRQCDVDPKEPDEGTVGGGERPVVNARRKATSSGSSTREQDGDKRESSTSMPTSASGQEGTGTETPEGGIRTEEHQLTTKTSEQNPDDDKDVMDKYSTTEPEETVEDRESSGTKHTEETRQRTSEAETPSQTESQTQLTTTSPSLDTDDDDDKTTDSTTSPQDANENGEEQKETEEEEEEGNGDKSRSRKLNGRRRGPANQRKPEMKVFYIRGQRIEVEVTPIELPVGGSRRSEVVKTAIRNPQSGGGAGGRQDHTRTPQDGDEDEVDGESRLLCPSYDCLPAADLPCPWWQRTQERVSINGRMCDMCVRCLAR